MSAFYDKGVNTMPLVLALTHTVLCQVCIQVRVLVHFQTQKVVSCILTLPEHDAKTCSIRLAA